MEQSRSVGADRSLIALTVVSFVMVAFALFAGQTMGRMDELGSLREVAQVEKDLTRRVTTLEESNRALQKTTEYLALEFVAADRDGSIKQRVDDCNSEYGDRVVTGGRESWTSERVYLACLQRGKVQ